MTANRDFAPNQGFAPAPATHVKLGNELDSLPLPNGKKVGDVSAAELARTLESHVPGVNHQNGKSTNAQIYATFLDELGVSGRKQSINDWLSAVGK